MNGHLEGVPQPDIEGIVANHSLTSSGVVLQVAFLEIFGHIAENVQRLIVFI